ncbi:MAG: protein kinase, partial [Gemmataceae bacterium]
MSRDDHVSEADMAAFSLGDLPDDSMVQIAQHLEDCNFCEARARRFDGLVDPFMTGFRQTEPAAAKTAPLQLKPRGGEPEAETPELPGYEILEELGRGGMGVVYKAKQHSLGRIVALKRIAGEVDNNLVRFCREGEAASKLQHANLVQVYEIGWHDGLPYLAMEYVGGGNLKTLLADGLLEPRRAAAIIATVSSALQLVHEQRIIHRDLKPSNILLTKGGVPKISDFGLAKSLDSDVKLTQQGMMVGTPCYMSPEQVREGGEVGVASDIHGLGVLLYEMISGRVPFEGPTSVETLQLILSQEPVPPRLLQPGLPRELETICLKCLHKEPGRRYATAAALADDLLSFLQDRPIQARPVSRFGRARRWLEREPRVALLIAMIVLVTAACLAGVIWKWQEAEAAARQARADHDAAIRARMLKEEADAQMLAARDLTRASLFARLGEWQQASLDYERALQKPSSLEPQVGFQAVCAALLAGRNEQAETMQTRLHDLQATTGKSDATCLALRAIALRPAGRIKELRALSDQLANQELSAALLPLHARALAQLRLGNHEDSIRLAE